MANQFDMCRLFFSRRHQIFLAKQIQRGDKLQGNYRSLHSTSEWAKAQAMPCILARHACPATAMGKYLIDSAIRKDQTHSHHQPQCKGPCLIPLCKTAGVAMAPSSVDSPSDFLQP